MVAPGGAAGGGAGDGGGAGALNGANSGGAGGCGGRRLRISAAPGAGANGTSAATVKTVAKDLATDLAKDLAKDLAASQRRNSLKTQPDIAVFVDPNRGEFKPARTPRPVLIAVRRMPYVADRASLSPYRDFRIVAASAAPDDG